ncbi:Homeobox-leucine zipper protein HAT22 [Acorus calamus]|uniref:Homeobox-leucine zipper protein HAT22 n=1 Tax=Acorus calamus TaxID=4465 RepID=A0AAV9FFC2_ACOCL|nr:Homeobox-leucine zipper protein HAT22 [Acorus calamus]
MRNKEEKTLFKMMNMVHHEDGLTLGLGYGGGRTTESKLSSDGHRHHQFKLYEPSLTLGWPSEDSIHGGYDEATTTTTTTVTTMAAAAASHSSPNSTVSSFSNVNLSAVKRERDIVSEEVDLERPVSSRISDEDEDGSTGARKKLRLTKEQSALLEDSFKEHSTLNPKQKQDLAHRLNLRPRQVEVWFQNRRARTKLKQTEVDCEFLKRCCESLTDENRRLQKELQELKMIKYASSMPLYMQFPAATLSMCPSCERIASAGGGEDKAKAATFLIGAPKPTHLYGPFTNSPAAC